MCAILDPKCAMLCHVGGRRVIEPSAGLSCSVWHAAVDSSVFRPALSFGYCSC